MLLRGEASGPVPTAAPAVKPLMVPVVQPTIVPVTVDDFKPEKFEVNAVPEPKVVEKPYRSSAVEEIYRRNITEAAARPAYFAMQTETLLQQRQRSLQQRIQDLKKKQDSPKMASPFVASTSSYSARPVAASSISQSAMSVVQTPTNASVSSIGSAAEGVSIVEESVSVRQLPSSNQFEGSLTIRNDSSKLSNVTVSTTSSCLKCFKSSYKVTPHSSVK